MSRMHVGIGITLASVAVMGCATSMTAQQEQDQLRAQVSGLQSQVAALNSQVEELRARPRSPEDRAWDAGGTAKTHLVLTAKEIQLALRRAGYYQGPIDGKVGAKTRKALKAFQQANHLVADGVAGTKTMVALQPYVTSPASSEGA